MSAALIIAYAFMAALITKTNTPQESYYTKNGVTLLDKYDFIIVGGGTAGCLVANRLSKNPNVTVLLIEAGGVENDLTEIPGLAIVQLGGPTDWNYKTVPQNNTCKALKNQVSTWNRGKTLGGTSVQNFMFYVRGHRQDFDNWEKEGAIGWSYKDVLPYFKDIENFTLTDNNGDDYHGYKGEIPITHPLVKSDLSNAFLESCKELGYNEVDYNGENETGCSRPQLTIKDGRRVSASKAFIRPVVANRSNLHVTLHSFVRKIVFDSEKRATGVVFEKNGNEQTVNAVKEIILSAGAIGTPHILLLSGVGPKEHLKEKGIKVVADLPVGENLQDHVGIGGLAATTDKEYGLDTSTASTFIQYGTKAYGPLANPTGAVLGFMSSRYTNSSYPDVELLFSTGSPARPQAQLLFTSTGLKDDVYKEYYLPKRSQPGFLIIPVLNRPKSRGTIKLNTRNPRDHPIIDPKYYSHEDDIKVAAEAGKLVLDVMKTAAMKKLGTEPWNISFPGCVGERYSEEYFKCLARQVTMTGWHYVGTCKMGCDNKSVVDPWLKVRGGVRNLRVVDASIMPTIVTGNVMAAIYMIAAKGADMILQEHGLRTFVEVNKQSI